MNIRELKNEPMTKKVVVRILNIRYDVSLKSDYNGEFG